MKKKIDSIIKNQFFENSFAAVILFLLLFCSNKAYTQCNDHIELTSQAEVDAFVLNYGCTNIEGDLWIGNNVDETPTDINNLDGLSIINSIDGDLLIQNNEFLESLEGIQNLNELTGHLTIASNDALVDLSPLNLNSIGGGLWIYHNNALTNLDDLSGINQVGKYIRIHENSLLENIEGLSNLTSIGRDLSILGNPVLSNLNGLNNIGNIGATLSIQNNTILSNLDALSNLSQIGQYLSIESNPALSNINGLNGITNIPGYVWIIDNDALSDLEGLNNLNNVGYLIIEDNEVLTNTNALSQINALVGYLHIKNNAALENLNGLDNLNSIGKNVEISENEALTNIDALNNLNSIGEYLNIKNNAALSNISGLNNLSQIEGNLTIEGNLELSNISGFNGITSIEEDLIIDENDNLIEISGFNNLQQIDGGSSIQNNESLTSMVGLGNLTHIGGTLNIRWNESLPNLEGLDNLESTGGPIQISNNQNLAFCCSILPALLESYVWVSIYNNLPSCNSEENIATYCLSQSLVGIAFLDENEDGIKDPSEAILNQSFTLEPSALVSFSNSQGLAYFFIDEFNDYTMSVSIEEGSVWEILLETSSQEINIPYFDTDLEDSIYYFPLHAAEEFIIQEIDLSSSITRCNWEVNYWLTYGNIGTTINNGVVKLVPDPLAEFVSSDPPADSTVMDTLYWFYEDLYPTYSNQIELVYKMPGVDFLGESIDFEVQVETTEGFGDAKKNLSSELICAYDPNDKLVTPAGVGAENYTLLSDTLEYTIRFQNTGNDTAFTVIVEDQLSQYLDLSTFRPIASSHDMETLLDIDTRIATFTFNDIYLPDSFVNEPASHGFIKFQIEGKANLDPFASIENTAEIYFDFNPPIVTNTVLNTFTETIPTVFLGKVFLEGCYEGDQTMATDLTGVLPLSQPFDIEPYYYEGNETVTSIPSEMVDWVLVEARLGTPNVSGNVGTFIVEQKAGLLLNDGSIVNTDGTTGLRFVNLEEGSNYHFAIRQLNHLDVISANAVNAQLNMNYDFSTSPEMAFGPEQQKISDDGTAVLFAGDANRDGLIINTDYDTWFYESGTLNTYSTSDLNLDGVIQTTDYDLWFLNKAKMGIIEVQY